MRPFHDRVLGTEDVRDDSQFTILFAVVLDPPSPAQNDPAAPVDPTADPTDPTAAATP